MATSDKAPSQVFHVNTSRDAEIVSGVILGLNPEKTHPWLVTIGRDDESRSLKQNRLSHMWYAHLGRETGNGREHERAMAKLNIGCPILMEDRDFAEFFQNALYPLDFQQRVHAMEYVPVTSLMTVKQFAEFLDTLDKNAAQRGIVLPQPEDLYFDALMKDADNERV